MNINYLINNKDIVNKFYKDSFIMNKNTFWYKTNNVEKRLWNLTWLDFIKN